MADAGWREARVRPLVIELLRTLSEAKEDWDFGSSGGGVKLMPSAWNEGSYAELERCLMAMRDGDASLRRMWWHLRTRYCWGNVVVSYVRVRKSRKGPIPVLPLCSELLNCGEVVGGMMRVQLYAWSERVDDVVVEEGVDYLIGVMYEGEYQLIKVPRVYMARVVGSGVNRDRLYEGSRIR